MSCRVNSLSLLGRLVVLARKSIGVRCLVSVHAFLGVVLTASDPPNVDVSPTSFVVNQTQRATFTCMVFGIPIPELTWYNTSDLSVEYLPPEMADVTQHVFVNGSGLDIIVSVLQFNRSLRTDQTTYTCVAINNIPNLLGTPEMGSATFYVQGFLIFNLHHIFSF